MNMIKKLNEIKETTSPQAIYLIVIDDKIVHASSPVTKILKQDPSGMSVTTFLRPEDKAKIHKTGALKEGEVNSIVRLGQQEMNTDFEIINEKIDDKTLSLVYVKNIRLLEKVS